MVISKNITAPKANDTAKIPYNLKRFSTEYLPFKKEELDPAIGLLSLIFFPVPLDDAESDHVQNQGDEKQVQPQSKC